MINADIYTLKHKDIDVIYFWKNNSEILNAAIISCNKISSFVFKKNHL